MASFRGLKAANRTASDVHRRSSRKKDTAPEVALRKALHARGLRYRVDVRDLPGRPDIVFRRARVAVFVDGDFWHGRNLGDRLRRLSAGHNPTYWTAKIRGNVARDQRNQAALGAAGWHVVRVWEGDLKDDVEEIAHKIELAVRARIGEKAQPEHMYLSPSLERS